MRAGGQDSQGRSMATTAQEVPVPTLEVEADDDTPVTGELRRGRGEDG